MAHVQRDPELHAFSARRRNPGWLEMNEEPTEQPDLIPMHIREIRLEDGRYMIFYTFGDEGDQEEDV